MRLRNMSLLDIVKATGKATGAVLKEVGKEVGEETLGLLKYGKDFSAWAYKHMKNTTSRYFTDIPRKDGESLFQIIFGKMWKKGHVGEGKTAKKIRDFKPITLGETFEDGTKVGFLPKVGAGAVNLTYSGIVNLPFGLVNNVALSPGGRLAVGITGAGLTYGAYKGGQANALANAEASELADMVSSVRSPLIMDKDAIENVDMGFKDHGAKGNLVFALHNLRQG